MVGSITELFNSSETKAAELLRWGYIGRSGGVTLILLPFLAHLRHRLRVSYYHQLHTLSSLKSLG